MKCWWKQKEIILYCSGELSPDKEKKLKAHLESCPHCCRSLAEMEGLFSYLEKIDRQAAAELRCHVDWEKSWKAIERALASDEGFSPRRQRRVWPSIIRPEKCPNWHRLFLLPRWLYVTAALLLAFLIGLFSGRFWIFKSSKAPTPSLWAEKEVPASLQEHLEELLPIIISIANLDESQMANIHFDPDYVRSLMLQNILLKHLLLERDPVAVSFLADLEIIFRELAHMKTPDPKTVLSIKNFIEENGILLQIDILRKLYKSGGL